MVFIRMLWWIWLGKKNTEFAILNLREFTVLAFAPFQFTLIYEHFSLPKIQCILNKLCTERWTLHFIWNIFPYFWWIILFHFISTLPLHLNRFVAKTSKLLPKKKKSSRRKRFKRTQMFNFSQLVCSFVRIQFHSYIKKCGISWHCNCINYIGNWEPFTSNEINESNE